MSHFFKKSPKQDVGSTSSTTGLPPKKQILSQGTSSSSLKLLDRQQTCPNSAVEALRPFVIEYSLMSEYVLLHEHKIPGAYVVPSAGSALKWFGVLFIRKGLYQGGVFRFTIYIPDNFPECHAPMVVFEPSVFHPLVNIETGELDVKRGFPKWRHANHLWQVVLYTRQVFYKIETHSPLNIDAANLYEKDMELYKLHVAENLSACHEGIFMKPNSEDNHAIFFTRWDPAVHKGILCKILGNKLGSGSEEDESKEAKSGLSWVQKGNILEKKL